MPPALPLSTVGSENLLVSTNTSTGHGKILALGADGVFLWSAALGDAPTRAGGLPPSAATSLPEAGRNASWLNGSAALFSSQADVVGLSAVGAKVWSVTPKGGGLARPIMGQDGSIYGWRSGGVGDGGSVVALETSCEARADYSYCPKIAVSAAATDKPPKPRCSCYRDCRECVNAVRRS